jgi:hypothetical protein
MCLCLCDCNKRFTTSKFHLLNGGTKSCGCWKPDMAKARVVHSHNRRGGRSATYTTWAGMMNRCYNPKTPHYNRYGGRGIHVCDRWHNFENFLMDMGERPTDMSIERKNNDGNYEPGNCKWATDGEQSRNTSRTRLLTLNGITACAKDHADRLGLNYKKVLWRLDKGWPQELAFSGSSLESNIYKGASQAVQ